MCLRLISVPITIDEAGHAININAKASHFATAMLHCKIVIRKT
jgi:hypothetical protein